jgi:hypothetical protein
MIQSDDIFAALILSLAMLRRLEVRNTTPADNPNVTDEQFQSWRRMALRAYEQVAVASAAKVTLSLGWYVLGRKLEVGWPWFHLVGFAVFLGWVLSLVWAWKIGTDARHMRLSFGIRLRRQVASEAAAASRGSRPGPRASS